MDAVVKNGNKNLYCFQSQYIEHSSDACYSQNLWRRRETTVVS